MGLLLSGSGVNEAMGDGGEVHVQGFKAGEQGPDQDDETREVVIAVDQHLGIIAADADADGLRTEEDPASSTAGFSGGAGKAFAAFNGDIVLVLGHVGGLEEADPFEEETSHFVIPKALYLSVLTVFHPARSDYLIYFSC